MDEKTLNKLRETMSTLRWYGFFPIFGFEGSFLAAVS